MSCAEPGPGTNLGALLERLGRPFQDPSLLARALTHRSADRDCNESLEFLGDAVLDLVVSHRLCQVTQGRTEGELSRLRARLVNGHALAEAARRLDLGAALRLGRGEERSGGRDRDSVLAGAWEALLGALYLDGGLVAAREFVLQELGAQLDVLVDRDDGARPDPKTALQEALQARGETPPQYEVVARTGPDHAPRFTVEVRHEDQVLASAQGASIREAQRRAARRALKGGDED